jgi:two-component system NarL family sensor kinase
MSARAGARGAWFVWAFALALTALALLLLYLNRFQAHVRIFQYWAENTAGAITFSTLGALTVSRRPENRIGWLFCAFGLAAAIVHFGGEYGIYTLIANPDSLPGGAWMAWLASLSLFFEACLAVTFLLLLFPDGRLPTSRWRAFAWLAAGDIAVVLILVAFAPGPLQEPFQFADNPVGIEGAVSMLDSVERVTLPVL